MKSIKKGMWEVTGAIWILIMKAIKNIYIGALELNTVLLKKCAKINIVIFNVYLVYYIENKL